MIKGHLYSSALLLSLLAMSPATPGQVYRYIDEQGNLTYSDTPPADKLDMAPAELPEVFYQPGVATPDQPVDQKPPDRNISISISSPVEGATILGSVSGFEVSASTSKELIAGETARLIVNGAPYATSTALRWSLTDLIRGEYDLSAEIIGENKKIIAKSTPVRVFVKRNIAR